MSEGIGVFRGVILDCDQMGELLPFYGAVLGAPKLQDGDRFAAIQTEGATVSLAAGGEQTGNGVALAVKVKDVEEAVRAAAKAGGRVISGPVRRAHEIVAYVADPKGNTLAIYQSA